MAEEDTRFDSWKEIGRYLGRNVRTVVRWEQDHGLPIHRVPGGKQARVFAYRAELDRWLAGGGVSTQTREGASAAADQDVSTPERIGFRRRWAVVAGISATVLLAGIAAWAVAQPPPALLELTLVGNELRALDVSGEARWTHRFTDGQVTFPPVRWTHIGDVTSDGREEILAAVQVAHPPVDQLAGELLSFSNRGRLQWSATADDRILFREGEYGPPWAVSDLVAYRTPAGARIAWTLHHFTWWPALVVTLDEEGRRLGTFVNSGWIHRIVPSSDGRYLFVAGVTNSRREYFSRSSTPQTLQGILPSRPAVRRSAWDARQETRSFTSHCHAPMSAGNSRFRPVAPPC
ncbi:MAG: hypothetical protein A3F70_08645 [Acidobacteria bacterium RIFCSPLOWO2_12_FULL_67_14]|nr:MAG: hypothetical protein A3H29_10905 [Acidobacteria bacterium RIFCSPLOWO2_02_FULL_67_21]OFW41594.1 MAG: hypothetical protein A3F70_08645 [Acidobacteria bacterium RIFCSPLOWO2_12_FULL_67_14]